MSKASKHAAQSLKEAERITPVAKGQFVPLLRSGVCGRCLNMGMVGEEPPRPRVELTPHANERMVERGWKFKDVKKTIFGHDRRYRQPDGRTVCEKRIKGRTCRVVHNPLQDNKILVITVMTA